MVMGTVSQRLHVDFHNYCNVRLSQFLKIIPKFSTQLKFDRVFNSAGLSSGYGERKDKKSRLLKASFLPRIYGSSKTYSSYENFYATLRTNSDKSGDTKIYKQFLKASRR